MPAKSPKTFNFSDQHSKMKLEQAYRFLRDDIGLFDSMFSDTKSRITPEGGFAIRILNKTGAVSVKGALVSLSTDVDNAVILQTNEYDTIGVFYDSGVADGQLATVVVSGIADVLYKDGVASKRGNILLAADTNGRAIDIANPGDGIPGTDTHFKECGHVSETKTAGTNVLVKCILHFN